MKPTLEALIGITVLAVAVTSAVHNRRAHRQAAEAADFRYRAERHPAYRPRRGGLDAEVGLTWRELDRLAARATHNNYPRPL